MSASLDGTNIWLKIIDLEDYIKGSRERKQLGYREANKLWRQLENVTRQMEILMCETADYPDEGEESDDSV